MVKLARKKQLYQELFVMPIEMYLNTCDREFDLVVAADVLSYIGDLSETIGQVFASIISSFCYFNLSRINLSYVFFRFQKL